MLAGGTDLLIQFRAGVKQPSAFIDLKRIPELVGITHRCRLACGSARPPARRKSASTREIRRLWPGLVEAVHLIGSTQIQGRGTVGGNLCNGSPAADTTCALIVNRRRVCHRRPRRGAQRRRRGFLRRARQDRPRPRRVAGGDSAPAAGRAHRRCVPAADSALRNGHRGGRRRGQRHARCGRRLHGGAGRASAPWRRRRCSSPRRRQALVGSRLDDDALARPPRRRAPPRSRSTTSAAPSPIAARSSAC